MNMNNNLFHQVEEQLHQVEDQMIQDHQREIKYQTDLDTQRIQRGQDNQVETQGIQEDQEHQDTQGSHLIQTN